MKGIGLTMEAIETNPVVYDLATDMIWRDTVINLDKWILEYAHKRYGTEDQNAYAAWTILKNTVYNCNTLQRGAPGPIIAARPDFNITVVYKNPVKIWYDNKDLLKAWSHLLNCSIPTTHTATFKLVIDIILLTSKI
jgi:alpha-N-acetylglucosaminidase